VRKELRIVCPSVKLRCAAAWLVKRGHTKKIRIGHSDYIYGTVGEVERSESVAGLENESDVFCFRVTSATLESRVFAPT